MLRTRVLVSILRRWAKQTGYLGAFYDQKHTGNGLKIEEILAGGPLTHFGDKIKAGMIIEKIDGEVIDADRPVELYLNGKVGKRVSVTFHDPKTGKRFEEFIRPHQSVYAEGSLPPPLGTAA